MPKTQNHAETLTFVMGDLRLMGRADGNLQESALLTACSQMHRADITIERHFAGAGDSSITLIQVDGEEIW